MPDDIRYACRGGMFRSRDCDSSVTRHHVNNISRDLPETKIRGIGFRLVRDVPLMQQLGESF